MKIPYTHLALFIILALSGCVEPFDPEIDESQANFLVIDGIITDQPGPYVVKITQSVPLQKADSTSYVTGVEVFMEEENGLTEQLVETAPGIYSTSGLQGIVGKRYRITLDRSGATYQSTWEELEAPAVIDSVYYQLESKGTNDPTIDIKGVQYYVDSHGNPDGVRNYRFEWEETWKIGVTYRALQDYIGNDKTQFAEIPLYECWRFSNSQTINLATTNGLSSNVLSNHVIPFITGDEERYSLRHSLLVKQFSLDEAEYLFWKALKEANEQLGSLFDKQPARVIGNISSTSGGPVALGYFSASGVTEQRIYIKQISTLSRTEDCNVEPETLLKAELGQGYESALLQKIKDGRIFYRVISPPFQGVIGAIVTTPNCSDCRTKGGDLEKPAFWDE